MKVVLAGGTGQVGTSGDGRQFVSWVHDADFMRAFREAWGVRVGLPATRWMLEIGAAFMRTETELVLKSCRVVPGRLLSSGFEFSFPHWPEAAQDLCQRWREAEATGHIE